LALPRDQIPVGEGLWANGEPGCLFYINRAELDLIAQAGPEWKLEDARFIAEAIAEPDAIFEGLKRPNQDDNLCYSVRPTRDPNEETNEQPRFGMAFVVFVSARPMGYLVFDWEWRQEDSDCPGHPSGWAEDFKRRTWQKT
jgi:hypothetical protein